MKVLEKLSDSINHLANCIVKMTLNKFDQFPVVELRGSFKRGLFLAMFFISSSRVKKAKSNTGDILNDAINKEKNKKKKYESLDLSKVVV